MDNAINERFGKLVWDNSRTSFTLEFAPLLKGKSKEEYLKNGYKEIIINDPPNEDGDWRQTGYDETDTQLISRYKKLDMWKPVRSFERYKIMVQLLELNVWSKVKQSLIQKDLYDLFTAVNVFNEDDTFFLKFIKILTDEFDISESKINQILDKSEIA